MLLAIVLGLVGSILQRHGLAPGGWGGIMGVLLGIFSVTLRTREQRRKHPDIRG
jgi:hypothetical protein